MVDSFGADLHDALFPAKTVAGCCLWVRVLVWVGRVGADLHDAPSHHPIP
jgi:hypothetical protein